MEISGHFYQINNLEAFTASLILNQNTPNPNTYSPANDVRVFLSFIPNGAIPLNFFPEFSRSDDTDSNGKFKINISDNLAASFSNMGDFYILAHKKTGQIRLPNGINIPIYNPVYRSEKFNIIQNSENLKCFFAQKNLSADSFIKQEDIDSQIDGVNNGFNELRTLSGTIYENEIHVNGRHNNGIEIKFDITLSPFTGSNLDRTIKHEIENFLIDLPGPDILVGLCIDTDEIKTLIRRKIRFIVNEMNTQIKDKINDSIRDRFPNDENAQENAVRFFNDNFVFTFGQIKYPIVRNREIRVGINTINFPIRAIEPVPFFGYPRRLI